MPASQSEQLVEHGQLAQPQAEVAAPLSSVPIAFLMYGSWCRSPVNPLPARLVNEDKSAGGVLVECS